ncbi:SH3 domain-containing protein [Thalassobaculum salexigens]|uniref:SH3 domain-containing protein n=1 Tax=Thalassobaculum salexigens TaxID=455360 RepID=UPI00248DE4E6|nr:SH3 domain-containing protein [Thalassobaculum salexigens]
MKRLARRGTAIGMVVALAACQTTNVGSMLPGGYLSDKADVCYSQRAALDSTGNTFETEVLRNVLIGAAGGVAVAAVTGQSMVKGGLIGAAAALAGTFLYNLQDNYSNPAELTDAAIKNVREENKRIDLLLTRFDALKTCRTDEAATIRVDLKANRITRSEAQIKMDGVKQRYQEDINQLDRIAKNIGKRTEGYAAVYNQIAADNGGNQLVVEQPSGNRSSTVAGGSSQRMKVLQGANMRTGPGTSHGKAGTLSAGTTVRVLEKEGTWYKIRNPQGGEAYIADFLLGPLGAQIAQAPKARITDKPAEKPVQDEKLEPIILEEGDREKVDDLQDVSLANVEKRDRVFDAKAAAEADVASSGAFSLS